MRTELERIAQLGCPLTYCATRSGVMSVMPYLLLLGPILEYVLLFEGEPPDLPDDPGANARHGVVISMLMHVR
jgi:hypothetical protein